MTRTICQLYNGESKLSAIQWREQFVSYTMARTSCQLCNGENNLSAIQWREQFVSYTSWQLVLAIVLLTTCSRHCIADNLLWPLYSWQISYAMARTSCQLYNGENKLSAIQWQEQVVSYTMARTSCQLWNGENNLSAIQWREQVVSYTMARTSWLYSWQLVLAIV
jgi:hypothetical protein